MEEATGLRFLESDPCTSHANSVEKDANGDYLLSARFTNCIYKISGRDGSVIWRLGGVNSSFALDGFKFSSQHDARQLSSNKTHTIISFLDNASDGFYSSATLSSAMVVVLDMETMSASLVKQFERPERILTELRGNVQTLSSGNTFICWSENARLSEFTPDGKLVYDASFASHRFVTYRGYKFNFTGNPQYPPSIAAVAYGADENTGTTVLYSSWNGATQVSHWNFYGGSHPERNQDFKLLATVEKTGFETMHIIAGLQPYVYAEAIAHDGTVLGTSRTEKTEVHLQYSLSQPSLPAAEEDEPSSHVEEEHSEPGLEKSASTSGVQRPEPTPKSGPAHTSAPTPAQGRPHKTPPPEEEWAVSGGGSFIDHQDQSDEDSISLGWRDKSSQLLAGHGSTLETSVVGLILVMLTIVATFLTWRCSRRRRIIHCQYLEQYDKA